jgi:hypothetical protein
MSSFEAEGHGCAVRLPVNAVLQERIAHLLTGPVGQPPKKLETFCHRASCAKGLLNTGGVLASVRDPRQWRAATLT